jgi:phospholipid transport system substrate-binding protein
MRAIRTKTGFRGGLRKRMKLGSIILSAILFISVLAPITAAENDTPTQVVEKLHTSLLTVMKEAKKLGYQGRYDRLSPVITATFDFPFIARIVVGRYWNRFSDEEKEKFVETFSRLSIATYAGSFDGYSGERFEVVSSKATRGGRVVVRSFLIKPEGDEINLDYILQKNGNKWSIVNVVANGVSDLSIKRADYTNFLEKEGYNRLIDKLKEKIACYSE